MPLRDVVCAYRPTRRLDANADHVVRIGGPDGGGGGGAGCCGARRGPRAARCEAGPPREGPLLDTRAKAYEREEVAAFALHVEPGCWEATPGLRERFRADLAAAASLLPPRARAKLAASTPFWVNASQSYGLAAAPTVGRAMTYHARGGAPWLRSVGMAEEKAGGVELFAAADHLHDRALWGTGGSLLHELCHAWHDAHVAGGFENAAVRDAYTRARCARASTTRCACTARRAPAGARAATTRARTRWSSSPSSRSPSSTTRRATAAPRARASRARRPTRTAAGAFDIVCPACDDGSGTSREYNKWYPFNNTQLRAHDPETHALLEELWFPPDDGPAAG